MSIDFNCPSCGKKLFSYEWRTRKYGVILKECKYCGAEYLDPRNHELAIEGIPEDEFRYTPYVFMIIVGGLLIWRAVYLFGMRQLGVPDEMQVVMPALFLILGIAAVIGAIIGMIRIKTGRKRMKFEKMLEESKMRMKDAGYVTTLKRLGYHLPDDFTSYYDDAEDA